MTPKEVQEQLMMLGVLFAGVFFWGGGKEGKVGGLVGWLVFPVLRCVKYMNDFELVDSIIPTNEANEYAGVHVILYVIQEVLS